MGKSRPKGAEWVPNTYVHYENFVTIEASYWLILQQYDSQALLPVI